MAVESVTLPARFRWNNGLEPWLLDNSNSQRIFALKASFRSEDSNSEVAEELGQRDIRQRGIEQDTDEHTRRLSQPFDIEFSPIGLDTQEDTHIFSQLQVLRDSRGGQSQGMEVGQGLTAQRHSVAGNVPSHFRYSASACIRACCCLLFDLNELIRSR